MEWPQRECRAQACARWCDVLQCTNPPARRGCLHEPVTTPVLVVDARWETGRSTARFGDGRECGVWVLRIRHLATGVGLVFLALRRAEAWLPLCTVPCCGRRRGRAERSERQLVGGAHCATVPHCNAHMAVQSWALGMRDGTGPYCVRTEAAHDAVGSSSRHGFAMQPRTGGGDVAVIWL